MSLALLNVFFVIALCGVLCPDSTVAAEEPVETKPLPSDADIRGKIPSMNQDELESFFQIYFRLNNKELSEAILAEARKRDPQLADALVRSVKTNPRQEKIDALITSRHYAEAVGFMTELQKTQYAGKDFPFDRQLAESYGAMEQKDRAKAAWSRVLASPLSTEQDREAARKELAEIAMDEDLRDGYALLEQKKFHEALAAAEKGLGDHPREARFLQLKHEAEVGRDLEECYVLIRKGRRQEALALSAELLTRYPNEIDAKLLHAQAHSVAWRFDEALPQLYDIKAKHYPKGLFPGEGAIADSLSANGDHERALESYRLAASDARIEPGDLLDTQRSIQDMERVLSSFSDTSVAHRDEPEGNAWLFRTEYSHFLNANQRVGVRAWYHDVALGDGLLVLADGGESWGSQAYLRQRFGKRLFAEGWLGGGSFSGVSGGVAFGRESHHRSKPGDEFRLEINRPSLDSLQPIVLDAVEDAFSYTASRQWGPLWAATFLASGRQVRISDVDIGDGYTLMVEVQRTILEDALETSGIYLAFRGIHSGISGETVGAGAIRGLGLDDTQTDNPGEYFYESQFSPQGLVLSGNWTLNRDLFLHGEVGMLYELADQEVNYLAAGGLSWRMSERADLNLGLSYYSNGQGVANQGGAMVVGRLGLSIYF